MNYEYSQIKTSYENNIQLNFHKYVSHFVNETFPVIKTDTKENIKKFICETNKIKIDILRGSLDSNEEYHNWIINFRNEALINKNIIPIDDIKNNPFDYLKSLILMNKTLEENNKKLFQPLPIMTSICQKYITIDTSAIMDIFGIKTDILDNLWEKYFNINLTKLKIKGYKFNDMISTDGTAVSISFIKSEDYVLKKEKHKIMSDESKKTRRLSEKDKEKYMKEKEKIKEEKKIKFIELKKKQKEDFKKLSKEEKEKKIKEFKKITTIDIEEVIKDPIILNRLLIKLKEKKLVFGDPGKRSPIYLWNGEKKFEYTRARRLFETYRLKYNRLKRHKYAELFDTKYIVELSKTNCKSISSKIFIEYIKLKIKLLNESKLLEYSQYCNKLKWHSYINTKRHEDNLLNEISKIYGKDIIIIIGDWSQSDGVKGISMPLQHMTVLLRIKFEVFTIDEYKTSQIYYEDDNNYVKCENLRLVKHKKSKEDIENKRKKKKQESIRKKLKWKKRKQRKEEEKNKNIAIIKNIPTNEKMSNEIKQEKINKLNKTILKINENNKETITVHMHSILTYKMSNKMGCINRDRNATRNMLTIVKSLLAGKGRLKAFQRPSKVTNPIKVK